MKKTISFVFFFCCWSILLFAQNSVHEKNILAFNVNGVKLGDSFDTFRNKISNFFYMPEFSDKYTECYGYYDENKVALFYFFNNNLYEIRVGYNSIQINKIGGFENLINAFIDKYGGFSNIIRNSGDTIFEGSNRLQTLNRLIALGIYANGKATIYFVDINLQEKMSKKKLEDMDFGF